MNPEQQAPDQNRAKTAAKALGAAATIAPLLAAGAHADQAQAKTFKVKNKRSAGNGTLNRAVKRANRHKGADRVIFRSRLSGSIPVGTTLFVSESLKIVGPGGHRLALKTRSSGSRITFAAKSKKAPLKGVLKGLKLKGVAVKGAAKKKTEVKLRITASTLSGKGTTGTGVSMRSLSPDPKSAVLKLSRSTVKGFQRGLSLESSKSRIDRSTIADNKPGGGVDIGADGSANITKSTISGNEISRLRREASAPLGGGVYSYGARVRIGDSTISGNSASGAGAVGGGLFGPIDVNASTVTANSAESGGGIGGPGISLNDSIVAGNTAANGPDCFGVDAGTSKGGNVLGTGGCGTPKPSDVLTADVGLAPLGDNGGPTRTHALRPGSPAINHSPTLGLKKDQRGIRRGKHPDSGSFERR